MILLGGIFFFGDSFREFSKIPATCFPIPSGMPSGGGWKNLEEIITEEFSGIGRCPMFVFHVFGFGSGFQADPRS